MSPRRSSRQSWRGLFGADATAFPPKTGRSPVSIGKDKGPKPSPPPSAAKNPSGTSQAAKKRDPAPPRDGARPAKKTKPAPFKRAWSPADELRILAALADHAGARDGALPDPSDLFAALAGTFDNAGADAEKLADKIRKLRRRHLKARPQGCPAEDRARRMFQLCEKVWGNGASSDSGPGDSNVVGLRRSRRKISDKEVDPQEAATYAGAHPDISLPLSKDGHAGSVKCKIDNVERAEEDTHVTATYVTRQFDELSKLYPYLAEELRGYASISAELIVTALKNIGDDEARDLDARCKKQRIERLNLEKSQAELTKAVLCMLTGQMN